MQCRRWKALQRRKPEELERGDERGLGDVVEELFAENNVPRPSPVRAVREMMPRHRACSTCGWQRKPLKLSPTWPD